MDNDHTLQVESSTRMRMISVGSDGHALLGQPDQGSPYELRVFSEAAIGQGRVEPVKEQLSRLRLADHPCIRPLIEGLSKSNPPEFKMGTWPGVDLVEGRLDNVLDQLTAKSRLTIAAQLVDATLAAHQVGICHGSFSPSTILVDLRGLEAKIQVDFSAFACSPEIVVGECVVEDDLQRLRTLLAKLLDCFLDNELDDQSAGLLNGRHRVILRRWLSESDETRPPSLKQWLTIFGTFLSDQEDDDDQTGVVASLSVKTRASDPDGSSASDGSFVLGDTVTPNQLGRFELIEKIGEGGMGAVFRATDLSNGEMVAVKVLRNKGDNIAQSIRRFRKEARLLSQAQSDHVTRMIDVGEDLGFHYLAMEFIHGIDLKKWIKGRGALPEPEALAIIADLAKALVEAHCREVVHRDIKPQNILLKLRDDAETSDASLKERPFEDFTLKLTDFGIARQVNQSESMEMTRAGMVLGTPTYMSPEQCQSSDVIGPMADVYSMGVTMYLLLTGSPPFEAEDFMKLAAKHCFEEPTSVQKRNARISDATARIVQRALAKEPEDRYGDAGQLLAEILKVVRGDAAKIESHPKLPEHQPGRVWDKTVSWTLQSKPAQLWPFVSNTERLNEAIGLPAVQYRTENDPDLGLRKFGSFTISGAKVSWEEHPFEWIEGQRMGILREFDSGPFNWFMSIVTLKPALDGGTELSHQVLIEPRNTIGRVLTTVEANWKGFRNLDRVYRRMDSFLQNSSSAQPEKDAFSDVKPLSKQQQTRISQGIDQVIESGIAPEVANALQTILMHWAPQELAQLRPLAIADRMKVEGSAMIDACLVAVGHGLLNLRWDVLCPTCRVSAMTIDKLSAIDAHTHCEACDVDFSSNIGGSIEMVFRVHPEIREVNDGQYCIGGPEHSPHVVAQIRVEPGECIDVALELGVGDYLVRGPRLTRTQPLRVQESAAPSQADFMLSELGGSHHTPIFRQGIQTLTLTNDLPHLQVVRVERMIPRNDVVTATMASANPMFRKLFPNQNFASDNPVESETMAFVATSINNVEELYSTLGDTEAYGLINEHHHLISTAVTSAGGSVVKTIGEKMLASFNRRDQAVQASLRIRDHINESLSRPIEMGIAVHSGPTLVTTQNNQLDYFGSTVRAVSSMPEIAGSDTLISEAVYSDPSSLENLSELTNEIETADLPSNPNFRVRRLSSKGEPSS